MKKPLILTLLIVFSLHVLTAQGTRIKKDPVGTWKFEAPYAPEEYTSGTITVGIADKKYNASMSFTGNEYKIPGEKVKFENDTLYFSIYVETENVAVSLKIVDATNMAGKAVYSEGEVPLTLTKVVDKK